MASKILGIDLGHYSVKIVVGSAGLRQVTIHDVIEILVPPGSEPLEQRAGSALALAIQQQGLQNIVPHWTFPGDMSSIRLMDFAFSGVKRQDLDRAVGSELEQMLPHDLDDFVYDFEVLPPNAGGPTEASVMQRLPTTPDAPTPAAHTADEGTVGGTRVIAVAATKEAVRQRLDVGMLHQLEPRSLVVAPMCFGRVIERAGMLSGGPLLVVDVGHSRTNLAVTHKTRTLFARSLSRGGRHVTQSIAKAWQLTFEQAERAKHTEGFVASALEPAQSPAWQRISDVILTEVAPLAREVRQTIAACRAQTGVAPKRVLLTGGGSRLRGLASYLQAELDLPVMLLSATQTQALLGPALAAKGVVADSALPALGVVLEAATGRPAFDLRKGEFTYKVDFSFIRKRAPALVAMALVMVAFAAGSAYASLYKLRKEQEKLDTRLETESTAVLGAPATAEEVFDKVEPGKTKTDSPLPKHSAFDVLIEISRHMPPKDRVRFEVGVIEIKKDKISIERASTDNAAAIDEIERVLKDEVFKDDKCIEQVQRGRVQASGAQDEKTFTLGLTHKCM